MEIQNKDTMSIVINSCYGGFNLSDAAIERCIELGMTVTKYNKKGNYVDATAHFVKKSCRGISKCEYTIATRDHKAFRCDPRVVQAVQELGEKADGFCSKLKIIEIPFTTTEGWHISEFDGKEHIAEDHATWY